MKIGQTIKELRKKKGIRQNVFCKMVGISQTSLSQIEADIKYPHSTTLINIAKALDMPETMIYLLSLKETDVPKRKKQVYRMLFPTIKQMIYTLIDSDGKDRQTKKTTSTRSSGI